MYNHESIKILKKLILIGIIAIIFTAIGYGQKNNVYTELGGAGYLMTFNYERMLNDNILARVGYGSREGKTENSASNDDKISFIPLGAAYLMGSGNHKLELGGGMTMLKGTLVMGDDEDIITNTNMMFFGGGYRYQIGTGGFLLSLKGYYLSIGGFSAPWAGMSIGWTL